MIDKNEKKNWMSYDLYMDLMSTLKFQTLSGEKYQSFWWVLNPDLVEKTIKSHIK